MAVASAQDGAIVRLDDDAAIRPRYDITAPCAARISERIGGSAAAARPSRSGSASASVSARQPTPPASSHRREHTSFLIAAVTENRAREVGICAIDLTAPHELLLWSFIDTHSYAETLALLHAYQPVEILVVETARPQHVNDAISKRMSGTVCRVVPIARKYFDQTKGAEDVKRIMANCVDINVRRDYVAMAALSCAMRYIEFIQGVHIAENTVKVILNPSVNKLLMDQATIASLELVQGTRSDSIQQSLWAVINNTQTAGGNRLLRSTILQPPCHRKTIEDRHEVINVFVNNPGGFFDLLDELPKFVDLDRLLCQLVMVPKIINPRISRLSIANVIALKQALTELPRLVRCLCSITTALNYRCELLDAIISSFRDERLMMIHADIERVINERVKCSRSTAQKRIQECFAVRAGIDGMLDVARRTYLDTIEKIHELVHKYKENLSVPVRLHYTARRGYHLLVPCNVGELTSLFIERVPGRRALSCSTKELNSLNARLRESLTAVYKLSNGVIQELLNRVRPHATILYTMTESIALLDMLLSFTNMVALAPPNQPYVRPRIVEQGNMVIQGGRHPLIESLMNDQHFIPNNTFFDPSSTFHVITGPNCAGKSTYMKSVAMIVVLAHMGSYVPAENAFIPLRDRICTRFGTSDDMEENASTFAVEMTEMSFILDSSTARSIIFIDELGRGTSADEGFGIAWSVSEELIQRRTYTCFATHFHDLNQLTKLYPNSRSYHMSTTSTSQSHKFHYKLTDGPMPTTPMYGIKTAKLCGLPPEIIEEAEKIYKQLEREERKVIVDESCAVMPRNRKLLHHLLGLRHIAMEDNVLRSYLQRLRDEFVVSDMDTSSN